MAATKELASIVKFREGTPFYRAFEMLTVNLIFLNGKDGNLRILSVIGAQSGYGTTTTALNLALTVASSGRRTLLVDGNLRSPALHTPFDCPQSPGLAELLTRKAVLKDAVRATRTSNLYFLPAGTAELSIPALLQPIALTAVFDQIKNTYDFAVVDTAPALQFPDAFLVAKSTSGTILVLPANKAPRRAAQEVRRRLERADIQILGIVMNRMDPRDIMSTF